MPAIVELILAVPLRRRFDYLVPDTVMVEECRTGCRVRASFGRRKVVGVIAKVKEHSQVAPSKLRTFDTLIDQTPLLTEGCMRLLQWAAEYYHTPEGEMLATALPKRLMQGEPSLITEMAVYKLSDQGDKAMASGQAKSRSQRVLLDLLRQCPQGLTEGEIRLSGIGQRSIRNLLQKQWIQGHHDQEPDRGQHIATVPAQQANELNEEQKPLLQALTACDEFQGYLVDGVTGSGKTEVYLQKIQQTIEQGSQALVLVPEIGLTPQTLSRFQNRLGTKVAVLHSQLSEKERAQVWLKARFQQVSVVIGTRSALFVPMPELGVIVIDEEHDSSFKQQSGIRYNARDLALVKAKQLNLPIVLGSATPSLESLRNVERGVLQHWRLDRRATGAELPGYHIVDLRSKRLTGGLSPRVLDRIGQHLSADGQVLVFLNRRGFAPTLFCHHCGWVALCGHCDARMTVHYNPRVLWCHHCDDKRGIDQTCGHCGHKTLMPLGSGTEKLDSTLSETFGQYPLLRIDRDRVKRLDELQQQLAEIQKGGPALLVGTQMIAKGHHFPNVSLVVIANADQGLMSADFRATERLAQTITQVAGRAGREGNTGEVLIQTYQPSHPLLRRLVANGYRDFARALMTERYQCALPPYSYLALLKAEAADQDSAARFLTRAYSLLEHLHQKELELLGPMPAPMERRAGRYRQQLFLRASHRTVLTQALSEVVPRLETMKTTDQLRWMLDKDPYEVC